jgi:hypothetical protein
MSASRGTPNGRLPHADSTDADIAMDAGGGTVPIPFLPSIQNDQHTDGTPKGNDITDNPNSSDILLDEDTENAMKCGGEEIQEKSLYLAHY